MLRDGIVIFLSKASRRKKLKKKKKLELEKK
jgi:hypothetical protein